MTSLFAKNDPPRYIRMLLAILVTQPHSVNIDHHQLAEAIFESRLSSYLYFCESRLGRFGAALFPSTSMSPWWRWIQSTCEVTSATDIHMLCCKGNMNNLDMQSTVDEMSREHYCSLHHTDTSLIPDMERPVRHKTKIDSDAL